MRPKFSLTILSLSTLFLICTSCGILDNNETTFEAGPILFTSTKSGTSQLYSINKDGSNILQLTHDEGFPVLDAKRSPDGSQIAIIGPTDPENSESFTGAIYLLDKRGDEPVKLTSPPSGAYRNWGDIARNFAWSSDGSQIAFTRHRFPEGSAMFDLFIVNVDSGEEQIISRRDTAEYINDWSTTGQLVTTFYRDQGNSLLMGLMNTNGEISETYGASEEFYAMARFSPDGTKLTYSKNRNLFVYDFNSEEHTLLYDQSYSQEAVAWAPSGDAILIQTTDNHGDYSGSFFMNIESGEKTELSIPIDDYSQIRITGWNRK